MMNSYKTLMLTFAISALGTTAASADPITIWYNGIPGQSSTFDESWGTTGPSDNWGPHHEATNEWLRCCGLGGNVMGHIGKSYVGSSWVKGSEYKYGSNGWGYYGTGNTNYSHNEQSFYTMEVDLDGADSNGLQLKFEYDSWIWNDGEDAFNVTASWGGSTYLLNPLASSDMYYDVDGSDPLLGMTGFDDGFNGFGNNPNTSNPMHGTAMFDLSGAAGELVTLSFNFASNDSYKAEGINIDKIRIWGECLNGAAGSYGSKEGCNPGGGGGNPMPEPGTLSLMFLGATAALHRRRKMLAKAVESEMA